MRRARSSKRMRMEPLWEEVPWTSTWIIMDTLLLVEAASRIFVRGRLHDPSEGSLFQTVDVGVDALPR